MFEAARLQVVVEESGIDKTSRDLRGLDAQVEKTGSSFGTLATAAKGFALGIGIEQAVSTMYDMAKAAADDAASVDQLNQAVINAEGSINSHAAALERAVSAGQDLAFSDDQTRAALADLTATTGDADEALRRLGTAQDLARGKGIDLVTAAKLLGRVSDDNTSVLQRYGVAVSDTATAQDVLNAVDAKFGGQAGRFAETDAAKFARAADDAGELQEMLGAHLLPAFVEVATEASETADAIQILNDRFNDLTSVIPGGTGALGGFKDGLIAVTTGGIWPALDGFQTFAGWLDKTEDESSSLIPVIYRVAESIIAQTVAARDAVRTMGDLNTVLKEMNGDAAAVGGESGVGKVGRSITEMFEAARIGKGELTEFANASEMVDDATERAAQGMAALANAAENAWAAQDQLNGIMSQAQGEVSTWEGRLADAQSALEILDGEMEENGSLTAEQQKQYDLLTWAVGRYKGGVEDSEGAVVDANAAQAEFIRIQDDLNAKLANGEISAHDYNVEMGKAVGAIDPAAGASYNLSAAQQAVADTIVGVVEKVEALLIKLGLIPAEKKTDVSAPGAVDAEAQLSDVVLAADRVPRSMTIDVHANTLPAVIALSELRGMTYTQSPPKEGPMAFQPDFSYIFETLVPAAEKYGAEALEHVKLFVESAQSAFDAMNAQLNVGERLQAGVPLPTDAQLDELKSRAEYALSIIVGVADQYSEEGLEAAKRFSDAGGAIFDLFGSVADLLDGDETFIISDEQISRMKFAIEHAVRSIQDSAAMFESDGMAAATEFSEAGLAVAEMLSAVRDAFAFTDDFSIMDDASISRMKFAIEHAVRSIRDTAAMFDEEGLAAAAAFSKSAEAVAEMLSAVRDAFFFTDDFQILDNDTISRLKFAIEHAVESIRDTALYLGSEGLEEAQSFSESASAVVGLIGDAVDAFVSLSELERGETDPNANIDVIVELARNVVVAVETAATMFSTEGLAAAQQFADAGGAVMGMVTSAVDAYTALSETAIDTDVADAARDIVAMSQMVVAAVIEAAAHFETEGLAAAEAFASAGGAALDLVGGVGDSIEAILTFGSEKKRDQIAKLAPSMVTFAEMVTKAVSDAASHWDEEGLAAVELFASSAGQAVSLMADVADAYEAMTEMSKITQKHVDIFEHNWQIILDMIPRLVEMSEPYLDDAEKFHEIAEMIAAEFAAAAEAISTVSGDAAKTVSGAAKAANMAVGMYDGVTAVDDLPGFDPFGTKNGGGSGGSGGGGSSSIYDLDGVLADTYRSLDPTPSLQEFNDWKRAQQEAGLVTPTGQTTPGFYNTYHPGQLSPTMGGMTKQEMHDALYAGARDGIAAGGDNFAQGVTRRQAQATRLRPSLIGGR